MVLKFGGSDDGDDDTVNDEIKIRRFKPLQQNVPEDRDIGSEEVRDGEFESEGGGEEDEESGEECEFGGER